MLERYTRNETIIVSLCSFSITTNVSEPPVADAAAAPARGEAAAVAERGVAAVGQRGEPEEPEVGRALPRHPSPPLLQ
jgi:hypothetical protein